MGVCGPGECDGVSHGVGEGEGGGEEAVGKEEKGDIFIVDVHTNTHTRAFSLKEIEKRCGYVAMWLCVCVCVCVFNCWIGSLHSFFLPCCLACFSLSLLRAFIGGVCVCVHFVRDLDFFLACLLLNKK